jgi:hypothetical protein
MSDDAIYCSELVYKGYLNGIHEKLGRLQPLKELDWQGHEDFIKQLSGHNDVPLDRLMITPVELSRASQLRPVYQYKWPVTN